MHFEKKNHRRKNGTKTRDAELPSNGMINVLCCVRTWSVSGKRTLVSFLAIPSGRLHLDYLIGLSVWDDALLDVIGVNQVLPSLVIEVKDGLMFFDSLSLDRSRIASLRCICS